MDAHEWGGGYGVEERLAAGSYNWDPVGKLLAYLDYLLDKIRLTNQIKIKKDRGSWVYRLVPLRTPGPSPWVHLFWSSTFWKIREKVNWLSYMSELRADGFDNFQRNWNELTFTAPQISISNISKLYLQSTKYWNQIKSKSLTFFSFTSDEMNPIFSLKCN